MFNKNDKLKKYIVLGRTNTVHNIDGDDRKKVITEVYVRKANTQMRGMFVEYERCMYNEIVGGRGRDCNLEEGRSFLSIDGTSGEFIDVNFKSNALETHDIRFVKTYPNKDFMKRDRETSYHQEFDIAVDENGNTYIHDDDSDDDSGTASTPTVKADFSTIPSGTKYLYHRLDLDGEDCIVVCDVNHWLKNDCGNDNLPKALTDDLYNLDPTTVELMESIFQADDMDVFEQALINSKDWNMDVNFSQFSNNIE